MVLALINKVYLCYILCSYIISTVFGLREILGRLGNKEITKKPSLVDLCDGVKEGSTDDEALERVETANYVGLGDIKHVIILPNYNEEEEVLCNTLRELERHKMAQKNYIVVMAMEESEKGHQDKFQVILDKFGDKFQYLTCTIHPKGIEGEIPGKGSNISYASIQAQEILKVNFKIDPSNIIFTISDADTIWNERYFEVLSHRFSIQKTRYEKIYAPPTSFFVNPRQTPSIVRAMDNSWSLMILEGLNGIDRIKMPCSAYSLSAKLAEQFGYWDAGPEGLPEDFHTTVKAYLMTNGKAVVEPIFYPVGCTHVTGKTYFGCIKERFGQAQRHLFGISDVAYTFRECLRRRGPNLLRRLLILHKVFKIHLLLPNVLLLSIFTPLILYRLKLGYFTPTYNPTNILIGFYILDVSLVSLTIITLFTYVALLRYLMKREQEYQRLEWGRWAKIRYFLKIFDFFWIPVTTVLFVIIPSYVAQVKYIYTERMNWRVATKM